MNTALIVDDNQFVRSTLREFLETSMSLRVSGEAADGMEAIHKARELKPDLIVMDLSMPGLSGAGAASAIKRLLPATRIIVFTLYSDSVGKNLARSLGVDLVVDKSGGSSGLLEALQVFLAV